MSILLLVNSFTVWPSDKAAAGHQPTDAPVVTSRNCVTDLMLDLPIELTTFNGLPKTSFS